MVPVLPKKLNTPNWLKKKNWLACRKLYSPPNFTACRPAVHVRLAEPAARQSSSVVGRKLRAPVVPMLVEIPVSVEFDRRGRFSSEYWPRVSRTTRGEKIAVHEPTTVLVRSPSVPLLDCARLVVGEMASPVETAFRPVFWL